MLGWAILFGIIAVVAFYFGFVAIASAATLIAKILFFVFLILLVLSFVVRALRGRSVL